MKLRTILIITLLMSLALTGCGNNSDSRSETEQIPESTQASSDDGFEAAADHAYTNWKNYLTFMEENYEALDWTYDYVEDYLDTDEWKDLSQARTACILSSKYLEELTVPENDLTEEEYDVLSSDGTDTAFISDELSDLSDYTDSFRKIVRYALFTYLEDYNTTTMEKALEKKIPNERKLLEFYCKSDVLTTNYLLMQLFNESEAQQYMEELKTEYPLIFQNYETDDLLSCDEAYAQDSAILDEIEQNETQVNGEILDELSSAMDEYNNALGSNDLNTLASITSDIIGSPQMFLCPVWFDSSTNAFAPYTLDENQKTQLLEYPADLNETEIYGYVRTSVDSESSVETYLKQLSAVGYTVKEESDENTWSVTLNDYTVRFNYKDDAVSFLFYPEDVAFTDNPCIYKFQ